MGELQKQVKQAFVDYMVLQMVIQDDQSDLLEDAVRGMVSTFSKIAKCLFSEEGTFLGSDGGPMELAIFREGYLKGNHASFTTEGGTVVHLEDLMDALEAIDERSEEQRHRETCEAMIARPDRNDRRRLHP